MYCVLKRTNHVARTKFTTGSFFKNEAAVSTLELTLAKQILLRRLLVCFLFDVSLVTMEIF